MLECEVVLVECPSCHECFPVIGGGHMACPFCQAELDIEVRRSLEPASGGLAGREIRARLIALPGRDASARGGIGILDVVRVESHATSETRSFLHALKDDVVRRRPRSVPEWERLELGPFPRLWGTVRSVIRRPQEAFRGIGRGPWVPPVAFFAAVAGVVLIGHALPLVWLAFEPPRPLGLTPDVAQRLLLGGPAFVLLGAPVVAALHFLLARSISHWTGSFRSTLRVTSYGFAPLVLGAVPVVGLAVGLGLSIAAHTRGFRSLIGLERPAAFLVAALPWVFLLSIVLSW